MQNKVIMVMVAALSALALAGYIGAAPKADETVIEAQNATANHHPVDPNE